MTPAPSLFRKLAKVQSHLGDLPRDKKVNAGSYSYSYVTEDAITKAVRDNLCPEGVAVFVSYRDVNRAGNITNVTCDITFADGETGETFTVSSTGDGSDPGDKGINKAMTSALRMGLCKTFLQAGDDDGQSSNTPREPARVAKKPAAPKTISDAQRRKLFAMVKSPAGIGEDALRQMLAVHNGGNDSTKDLPVSVFDAIMAELERAHDPAPVSAGVGQGEPLSSGPAARPDPESPSAGARTTAGTGNPAETDSDEARPVSPPSSPSDLIAAFQETFDAEVEE